MCAEHGTSNTSRNDFPHHHLATGTSLQTTYPPALPPSRPFLSIAAIEFSSLSRRRQDIIFSLSLPHLPFLCLPCRVSIPQSPEYLAVFDEDRSIALPIVDESLYAVHESIISGFFIEISKGGFQGGIGRIGWSYYCKGEESRKRGKVGG